MRPPALLVAGWLAGRHRQGALHEAFLGLDEQMTRGDAQPELYAYRNDITVTAAVTRCARVRAGNAGPHVKCRRQNSYITRIAK